MALDAETLAKSALGVAETVVAAINPVAGIVVKWAADTTFAIIDQHNEGGDAVAAAQLAGDRVADLVEALKLGPDT